MRRRTLAGVTLLCILVTGGVVGAQVGGEPTVATQTFTHEDVVTYTIPTETVVTTEVQTTTVVETVTVTAPTTTEPEPPPLGTYILVTEGEWICDQPIAEYATNGFPVTVETRIPNAQSGLNGSVRLMAGCEGDPNADPDLILEIHGDGGTLGDGGDAIHMGGDPGPANLQIEGFANCGAYNGTSHQDGVQMLWARNITFRDFEIGDWETQEETCHGAGGLWYVSGNSTAARITNVVCVRCRMVGSNPAVGAVGTGFYLGLSTDSGAIESCFSANRPFIQDGQAVRGLNIGNLFIDRDAGTPQPAPTACEA